MVNTHSDRLVKYRKMILELLFAERNHVCAVCVMNGHCELQWEAAEIGMDHVRYDYLNPDLPMDASHKQYVLDHNRCILCTRCVRVCDEIEGAHAWDVMGRGVDSRIVADLNQPWGTSTACTSCGKCVQVCPTGALTDKVQLWPRWKNSTTSCAGFSTDAKTTSGNIGSHVNENSRPVLDK